MTSMNYILILLQDLKKKSLVLDGIINANQKQKEALEDPNLDPEDFDKLVEEKTRLIEELERLDSGFEQVFSRVREELQGNKESYKAEIREMQKMIREITDKSATIQTGELRNKELMQKKFSDVKRQVREIRASQKVVNQYYKNMMKANYVEPQFMDNKK